MVTLSLLSLFSGAVADDNTAVYKVFREHFDQLLRSMGTRLIPVLYSKGLISDTDKTRLTSLTHTGNIDKATKPLNAVETTMKAEPRAAQVIRMLNPIG